jgi:hypothetical protein
MSRAKARSAGVTSRTKAPRKGTPLYVWWLEERRAAAERLEAAFWRDVALPLSLRGYPLPLSQFRFHPRRRWALDYAYLAPRVGVDATATCGAPPAATHAATGPSGTVRRGMSWRRLAGGSSGSPARCWPMGGRWSTSSGRC